MKSVELFKNFLEIEKNYSEHTITSYVKDVLILNNLFLKRSLHQVYWKSNVNDWLIIIYHIWMSKSYLKLNCS